MNNSDFRKVKSVVNSTVYGRRGHGDFHRSLGGRGGFDYNGYFKVIDSSETNPETEVTTYKVSIVDGADYEDEDCGIAIVNGEYSFIPAETLTVTGTCWIYLVAEIDESETITLTIEQKTQPVVTESETEAYALISRVFFEDGIIRLITQEAHGEIRMNIIAECEE